MRKSFSLLLLAWLGQGSGSLPKTDNDVISGCVERCLSIITHSLHNVYAVSDKRPDISRYLYQRMSAIEALCLIKCGLWHCVAFWTWRTVVCSLPHSTIFQTEWLLLTLFLLFFFYLIFTPSIQGARRKRRNRTKAMKKELEEKQYIMKNDFIESTHACSLQTEH